MPQNTAYNSPQKGAVDTRAEDTRTVDRPQVRYTEQRTLTHRSVFPLIRWIGPSTRASPAPHRGRGSGSQAGRREGGVKWWELHSQGRCRWRRWTHHQPLHNRPLHTGAAESKLCLKNKSYILWKQHGRLLKNNLQVGYAFLIMTQNPEP